MYKRFYNFNKDPFRVVPDPYFLFMSPTHREALAQLVYGVQSGRGFIVLTGEVGVGKTTIVHTFLEEIKKFHALSAYIFNPRLSLKEFLYILCDEFNLPKPQNKAEFLLHFQKFLLQQYREKRPVVLVIDEAHQLSADLLEEIRLLLNLETHHMKLLQVVLAGQPELWDTLSLPEFRQLRQRITLYHSISPLNFKESTEYIKQRLERAGGNPDLFTPKAIKKIYELSKGIPRLINVLCSNALVLGYALEKKRIDTPIIMEVANDLKLSSSFKKTSFYKKTLFFLIGILIIELGGWGWLYRGTLSEYLHLHFSQKTRSKPVQPELKNLSPNNILSSEKVSLPSTSPVKEPVTDVSQTLKIKPEGIFYTIWKHFGFITDDLWLQIKELNPKLDGLKPQGKIVIPSRFSLNWSGKYTIHITTTSDFKEAEKNFWNLLKKGHRVLIYPLNQDSHPKFVVCIGCYNQPEMATSVAKKYVAQKRLSHVFILKVPAFVRPMSILPKES